MEKAKTKPWRDSNKVEFECLRCEAKHLEEFSPKKTFHCKTCGNIAYPVVGHMPKEQVKRICKYCGKAMRATSPGTCCASCDR